MQFHHHGYALGDPRKQPALGYGVNPPSELPDELDVLIVGAGPAGLIAAAQLSQFPTVLTRVVERRNGRLEIGQADGIQARSVETFQAFGFANRIIEEAFQITVMAFWKPDPDDRRRIARAARTIDDPAGISEFPHLIVNQARVQDYFLEVMADSPSRLAPDYGLEFVDLQVLEHVRHPVAVTLRRVADGAERVVRCKYLLGCDGARSRVRQALGLSFTGDQAMHAWGVMDALAVTDFPDIRVKCAIQSDDGGSILLIPREGGFLFRMYVDLGEVSPDDAGAVRNTTLEEIIARANAILYPYVLDVRDVAWHSVYEVGHRLTERFDDASHDGSKRPPHVFIAGDACHTHSAKAGQGMNVSMQDGFNVAWKLGHVLDGRAPSSLLSTYSDERQVVARNLIEFDRRWSSLMAAKPEELAEPGELEEFYIKTFEFPAGFMTQYEESILTGGPDFQELAGGFPIGKRFRSAPVVRVCDAKPMQLGHHARADGRWRIYAFADEDAYDPGSALRHFADWANHSPDSPVAQTPSGLDIDAWFDLKVIFQSAYTGVDLEAVPALFLPRVGPFQLIDYEKVYATDPEHDIFVLREIHRNGALVVVRPDQYVASVLPLDEPERLGHFFDQLLAGNRPDSHTWQQPSPTRQGRAVKRE